jgi:hypothetical protein
MVTIGVGDGEVVAALLAGWRLVALSTLDEPLVQPVKNRLNAAVVTSA